MEAKPLSAEAIALTEKKMDMTLDDIIKMSKKNNSKGKRPSRTPNKKRSSMNGNGSGSAGNSKAQRFIESRSAVRQGVLAQRRSNFKGNGNQFPLQSQVAQKAAAMPFRNKFVRRNNTSGLLVSAQRRRVDVARSNLKENGSERPRTMDALFAKMKEQRMKAAAPSSPPFTNGSTRRQFAPARRFQQQRQGWRAGPSSSRSRRFG